MKRLFASLTVFFLCCSMFLLPTQAAETTATGTCGDNLSWTLDGNGVLTISGTGKINYSSFARNNDITSVVVDEGVTHIGYGAFSSCSNLTEVILPTTLERIEPQAFSDCSSLVSITIPANVNYIGLRCFSRNTALTSFSVDPVNQFFTSVDGVLFTHDMSTLIAYPSGKQDTTYTVPDGVETIQSTSFFANKNLTNIIFPESLTTIEERAFMQSYLQSIHLPASVTTIDECALSGMRLQSITVDENNPFFTSIDGVLFRTSDSTLLHFPAYSSLTDYTIPDGTQIIDGNAFMYAYKLRNVFIPASVTEARNTPFNLADYLLNITVDPDNQVYCSVDGVMFSKDMTALLAYPAGNSRTEYSVPEGVTTLGTYSFYSARNLQNLIMPESLSNIQNYVFGLCYRIPTLVFPEGIKTIGDNIIFLCINLESIYLPVSLESIEYLTFDNCTKLTDIYYGGSEEQWEVLCSNSNIYVPNGVTVHFQNESTNDNSDEELTGLDAPSISVTTNAKGKPVISWTAITNAASYEVWYATSKTGTYTKLTSTTASVLSVTHTGATLGEDYYYKVCAVNGSTKSEFSSIKGVYCDLAQPTIKVTTSASSGKPYISWTAVEGATGYEIYRSTSKTGSYTKLVTTTASKLSVTHTGAEVGQAYYYKVRAIYSTNTSCNSALTDAKGVYCDLPQPTIKVTTSASSGKPYISWTAVDGATAYEVYYCGTSNGTYSKLYTATSTKLSITHTGATAGEDYYYKVRAVYGSNTSCNSALTAYKGVWCDLKAPTIKVTNRLSDGKPYITWGAVDGATGYQVYYSNTSTGTYKLLTTTASTKLYVAHTGAKVGQTYFYKVVAVHSNSKCNSGYSAYKGVWCDLARSTLNVELNDNGKPYITWTAVTGATSYKVYCSTNGSTYKLLFTDSTGRLYCTHSGAKSGVQYTYKVVAVCAASSKCNSDASIAKFITAR